MNFDPLDSGRTTFLFISFVLVLFMVLPGYFNKFSTNYHHYHNQPGLALYYSGMVRLKTL